MRCYQHIGLTDEAEKFLENNCQKVSDVVCHNCLAVVSEKRAVLESEQKDSFYGDGPTLDTYIGKDGKKIKEIVQAMPWSSGPCGFICLELEDGTRIGEWSEKGMSKPIIN